MQPGTASHVHVDGMDREGRLNTRVGICSPTPSRRPTPQMRRAALFPPGKPFAEIKRFAPDVMGAPTEAR